ncbi:MAG: terminase small subunit [Chloroflexi bacterium]|nr:terminase small subunit [Chloroflexota bacterium]
MAERSERTKVTQDIVVQEMARLAFSNMADYLEWGPDGVRIKDLAELTHGASRAVSEITETVNEGKRTLKFKLHDKKGTLDSLSNHLRAGGQAPCGHVAKVGYDINTMLDDPEASRLVRELDNRLKMLSGGEGILLEGKADTSIGPI